MTLTEIEALEKAVLTCAEVAPVLGENPHELHMTAIEHPEWLQFPVIRKTKTRVVFPRLPFLMYMKGEIKNGESNNIRNS